jgi:glycosyltransferase involved in cell wall biosynthesis
LLEAMACGVPVVATRIAAHEELITDGHTGLLTRLDDPRDVAEKIDRLLGDRDLARKLGAAAREVVERRHDITRTAAELAALYRRAAGAARTA